MSSKLASSKEVTEESRLQRWKSPEETARATEMFTLVEWENKAGKQLARAQSSIQRSNHKEVKDPSLGITAVISRKLSRRQDL